MRTASSSTSPESHHDHSENNAGAPCTCCCCLEEKQKMFGAQFDDGHGGHIPHLASHGELDAHLRCEEFLTDCCTDDLCPEQVPVASTQCTDQCVVVACDDPAHACDHNYQDCTDIHCNEQDCNKSDLERIMQCCTDNHAFPTDHHPHDFVEPGTSQNQWDALFSDPCCPPQIPMMGSQYSYASPPNVDRNQMSTAPSFSQADFYPIPSSSSSQYSPLLCMWGDCSDAFTTVEELICHVNTSHLRLPFHAPPDPNLPPQARQCLWKDCHEFRDPLSFPAGAHSDLLSTILTSHIVQEHLGQHITSPCEWRRRLEAQRRASAQEFDYQMQQGQSAASVQRMGSIDTTDSLRLSPAESVSGDSSLSGHDCQTGVHKCLWRDCGINFDSCDALTDHLTQEHVGGGKSHYDCFWAGCRRNDSNGFTSKQKICRHLQSHTGHRPFLCKICKQKFSEAATLQQHMRRHTQEKPYICDYPGCEKAFAITGALTIHKRTHNGEKPFKCPQCDRAFSESSNLSKHLRTHTGVRPYACNHPGCGKAFARPDQLTRHMSVHKRKQYANATPVAPILKV